MKPQGSLVGMPVADRLVRSDGGTSDQAMRLSVGTAPPNWLVMAKGFSQGRLLGRSPMPLPMARYGRITEKPSAPSD